MLRTKRWLMTVILVLVLGLIGGMTAFTRFQARQTLLATKPDPIVLEIFSQPVFVKLPQATQEVPAQNGQPIIIGSTIRTGETGRAQVLYPTHTVTRVDFNSQFTVTAFQEVPQQIRVTINNGRVWSRITKLLGKESYETQTGTVLAAVRGTSYGHGILADGRNKIQASKHSVNVSCINNTQAGSVTQQTKFFLDCKEGSPSTIEPFDDADSHDEWYLFNIEQDRLLDERFGAGLYDDQNDVLAATTSASASSKTTPKSTSRPTKSAKPSATVTLTAQPTTTPQTTAPTTAVTASPTPTQTPISNQKPTPPPSSGQATPTSNPTLFNPNFNPQLVRGLFAPTPTPVILR